MKKTLITTMFILQSKVVLAGGYCDETVQRAVCGGPGANQSPATCARVEACGSLKRTSEKLEPLKSRSEAIGKFAAGFKVQQLSQSVSKGFTKTYGDRVTPKYMMAPDDKYIDELAKQHQGALTDGQISSLKVTAKQIREKQKEAFDSIIRILGSESSHITGATARRVVLAQEKLRQAQESTPQNTQAISEARKELLEAATITASKSEDRDTRRKLAKEIQNVSDTAGTIHAAISPIAKQIQGEIDKEKTLIKRNRDGIAKWYVKQKSGELVTDRAEMLSKLMMLQLKDIGEDATAVLDSLKADIDKSILGKYIAEEIGKAKQQCKQGSNVLESLNALGRAATDLACERGGVSKQAACQAFQGKFAGAIGAAATSSPDASSSSTDASTPAPDSSTPASE